MELTNRRHVFRYMQLPPTRLWMPKNGTKAGIRMNLHDCVRGFPKIALFATEEEELVDPMHSRRLAEALKREGIPKELKLA